MTNWQGIRREEEERMSTRITIVLFIILTAACSVLATEQPEVVQPNAAVYSAGEQKMLMDKLTSLEVILDNEQLGSRRTFAQRNWQSLDFATYTAGLLAKTGYVTYLASSTEWPDDTHTWVLVEISLGENDAWIPVEASPQINRKQQSLGYVPHYTDDTQNLQFDERYLRYSSVEELPPNLPPVAQIQPPFRAYAGEPVTFSAIGTTDPDGEIVLYHWDFGDDTGITVTTTRRVRHVFEKAGLYTIVLIVIDDGGKSVTTSITQRISAKSGCGCGG